MLLMFYGLDKGTFILGPAGHKSLTAVRAKQSLWNTHVLFGDASMLLFLKRL